MRPWSLSNTSREQFPHAPPWAFAPAGNCLILLGRAEEAVAALQQNIRADPHAPYMVDRYALLGFATLLLGRDEAAIAWDQRALAANPNDRPVWRAEHLLHEAAANARLGHLEEAHRLVNQANQVWPWYTVRSHAPGNMTSSVYAARNGTLPRGAASRRPARPRRRSRRFRLRNRTTGCTRTTISPDPLRPPHRVPRRSAPRTSRACWRVARRSSSIRRLSSIHGIVFGAVIAGRVGLAESGWGTSVADPMQDRLRRKMAELTGGDRTRVIVVVGWSSERFGGRNLALRLVALGYTQVTWYRGGREAWEVAGLPGEVSELQPTTTMPRERSPPVSSAIFRRRRSCIGSATLVPQLDSARPTAPGNDRPENDSIVSTIIGVSTMMACDPPAGARGPPCGSSLHPVRRSEWVRRVVVLVQPVVRFRSESAPSSAWSRRPARRSASR